TDQHPLLAWNLRTSIRLHNGRLYVVNSYPIKLGRQAKICAQIPPDSYGVLVRFLAGEDGAADKLQSAELTRQSLTELRNTLRGEKGLIIIFGSDLQGTDVEALVKFGSGIPDSKFICLGDYANSHGAADMGLYPDLLPGYTPVHQGGKFTQGYGSSLPNTPGM